MTDAQPGPGHNLPDQPGTMVSVPPALLDEMHRDNKELGVRAAELLAAVPRAPKVEDEDTKGQVMDLVKLLRVAAKNAEAIRVATKAPYQTSGKAVDAYFEPYIKPLKTAMDRLGEMVTEYDLKVAAAERKRLEEEQREKARLEREAQRKADADAAAAQLLADGAEDEDDLGAALEAEDKARDAAVVAGAAREDALEAETAANVNAATLSHSRGDVSAGGLRTRWKGDLVDRRKLNIELLRDHFTEEALKKAINAYVMAGGRDLGKGAHIREVSKSVIT